MPEELKSEPGDPSQPSKKPAIEILRDIHATSTSRKPRHVANPILVDRAVFYGSCVSLVLCVVIGWFMIWEIMGAMFGLKCIASILVLLWALFIFRSMNNELTE